MLDRASSRPFRALVASQGPGGGFHREVAVRHTADLPPGDLLIRVRWSSLNYKDALAATGRRGVARSYPLTPGIDAAGVVVESSAAEFSPGDRVLACGNDLGIAAPGGFGQYISVPAAWAMKLPAGLTERESMIFGTAGFTAALCVQALREDGLTPDRGEVLVTGASGGVGSFAVAFLAQQGFAVTAATGKTTEAEYLESLGARRVISRKEADDVPGKALLHEKWAGVVDTVGGGVLAAALKAARYGGSVAACGNAMSADLPITVFPFILRGVRLLGIDAARGSLPGRKELWEKLAGEWRPRGLEDIARDCTLDGLNERIDAMLRGAVRGRVVVDLGTE